jgi:hypothetical protein
MIGDSTSLFGGMPDAISVMEQERPLTSSTTAEAGMNSSITSAFMGTQPEDDTDAFAKMLMGNSAVDETPTSSYEGTADLAHALGRENEQAPTSVTTPPEFQQVFGLAEQANAKDALALAAVKQDIVVLTAELQAKVLEAQAQNAGAVQEEAKILMAQETGNEGVYYVNFLRQLILSVERALKSMRQIMTNSAGRSASWAETASYHKTQREEHRLQTQAAG